MRIRLLSDLHLECYDSFETCGIHDDIDCDAVVLAGDIHNGTRGIEWAAQTFSGPVIYVLGNHEYYSHDVAELLPRARRRAANLGIHLLECEEVRIQGIRFLGCTLWTGFDAGPLNRIHATRIAHSAMADFSQIRNGDRLVLPSHIIEWYEQSSAWLARNLDPFMPAVVITHFAPTRAVVNPRFGEDDELTPYFYNDLGHLMGGAVPLWIYGHNHYSDAVTVTTQSGQTYVVSNQIGYPDENVPFRIDRVVTF